MLLFLFGDGHIRTKQDSSHYNRQLHSQLSHYFRGPRSSCNDDGLCCEVTTGGLYGNSVSRHDLGHFMKVLQTASRIYEQFLMTMKEMTKFNRTYLHVYAFIQRWYETHYHMPQASCHLFCVSVDFLQYNH